MSKAINISELKAHLSKYLRLVKSGIAVTVTDRNLPIAKISSIAPDHQFVFKDASLSFLDAMASMPPLTCALEIDSLALLVSDRAKR